MQDAQFQQQPREPIRLLALITKLELGGAQQVVLNTLQALSRTDYQLYLIAGQGGFLDADARAIPQIEVHLWRELLHPINPFWDMITLVRLVRFMRQHRIQIVHTHSSKAGILGRLAAWLANVPCVLHTVHGWPFHERQNFLVRGLLIAVSLATLQKGLAHRIGTPSLYQVIYPASDLRAFTPGTPREQRSLRLKFHVPLTAPLIGMVACLKPQKAPLQFVWASHLVSQVRPEARFLLVGDGPLRRGVEKEVQKLGLKDVFILAGWRRDVAEIMKGLDIFVLSSLWEGLPCVFSQAMSSGLAIVATDIEGAREAVHSGQSGILVPPANPQALSQAILSLLDSPATRKSMGQAGLTDARKFDLPVMFQQLDTLYKQCFFKATRP
jgi:glycosyltransferase involved in cell wall biosynthesis